MVSPTAEQGNVHPLDLPDRARRQLPLNLVTILVGYLLLATAFSLATPILEASDENSHLAAIWNITAGHGLPILTPRDRGKVLVPAQEAGQPPLYYLVVAAVTFWIHFPSPTSAMTVNPYPDIGHPDWSGWNKNLVVHTAAEDFPWHGLSLTVHLGRFVSLLFGGITVTLVYMLAGTIAPNRPDVQTLATALTAFNPMFLFIAASVDNDALAVLLTTTVIVLLAKMISDGRPSPRRELVIGVVVGLALLTKLSAGTVALPAAAVFLWLAWRRHSWRNALRAMVLLGLPLLLIDGWWIARNWALYGDPTGLNVFLAVAGRRETPLTLAGMVAELPGVWTSFWGVFGIFDVLLPHWYYVFTDVLGFAALGGLFLARRRRGAALSRRSFDVLLLGWLAVEAVLLVRWTSLTLASTGRLLFPALASTSIFFAVGLAELARRVGAVIAAALAGVLWLGAGVALPLAIIPAYAEPAFVPAAALHPTTPSGVQYGGLSLVGVSLPEGAIQPGAVLPVHLSWWKRSALSQNLALSVQLHGPDRTLIARTDELPGGGKVLTARLPTGLGWEESVPLRIPATAPAPFLGSISVYVYPINDPDHRVAATTAAGQDLPDPVVATREVRRSIPSVQLTVLPQPVHVTFGGRLTVTSVNIPAQVQAGTVLNVGLQWLAQQAPAGNFATVLTGRDAGGRPAFTLAALPHAGLLPTTDWVSGETVTDTLAAPLAAQLSPGTYTLSVGLVDLTTGSRLPTADGASEAPIGRIAVVAPVQNDMVQTVAPDLSYGALRLLQVTVPKGPLTPGEQVPVALLWRLEDRAAQDLAASLQLRGPDGVLIAQRDVQPGGAVATTAWLPEMEISNVVTLTVAPAAVAPSLGILAIYVYPANHPDRPITAVTAQERPDAQPVVARLVLRPPPGHQILPPSLPLQPNVVFGQTVRLLGAAVPGHVAPGGRLTIALQWQAVTNPPAAYTVFVHALDAKGQLAFQFDGQPHGGALPTTDWVADQVVADTLTIPVPVGMPAGSYSIVVGLYRVQTLARLSLPDGQTQYPLATVLVGPAGGA